MLFKAMLNLLTSEQTRAADQYTISRNKISSVDLMESAARAFVSVFTSNYSFPDVSISIYCGTGNNGGDGLAIARILKERGYDRLSVKIASFNPTVSNDFSVNLQRLHLTGISITELERGNKFPDEEAGILIDALLGSGLSRPLEGQFKALVEHLNRLNKTVVSVDVPTGMRSEGAISEYDTIMRAELVVSFQRPRINFFLPESAPFINRFRYVDIGLDEPFIQSLQSRWKLIEPDDIRSVMTPRKNFSHKGSYGHALIIAGSSGTMGAALLCADACLHSGAGLTTACIPIEGLSAINSASPEIMTLSRGSGDEFPAVQFEKYQAIAIGPGLGRGNHQMMLLNDLIQNAKAPLVLDADALNILSKNQKWIEDLPANTVLTPHMKEFDHLFGPHLNWTERIEKGLQVAQKYHLIILLKNQYSFIILPEGKVMINPTGNPAMASGGMGDVLTGVLAAFLAQGYPPGQATIAACYLHGKAGDLLKEKEGMMCIPARYLIRKLPAVIGSYS